MPIPQKCLSVLLIVIEINQWRIYKKQYSLDFPPFCFKLLFLNENVSKYQVQLHSLSKCNFQSTTLSATKISMHKSYFSTLDNILTKSKVIYNIKLHLNWVIHLLNLFEKFDISIIYGLGFIETSSVKEIVWHNVNTLTRYNFSFFSSNLHI